jgi:two-component system sensor histidine kinase KdpD
VKILKKGTEIRRKMEYDLLRTAGLIGLATAISSLLAESLIDPTNVVMVYYLMVVVVSSITTGYLYGSLASVAGVMGINYFFTYPYSALNFSITKYPVTFASMLIASLVISTLTSRIKEQRLEARDREKQSEALYRITRRILGLRSHEEIAQMVVSYLAELFRCGAVVYLGDPGKGIYFAAGEPALEQRRLEPATAREAFFRGKESNGITEEGRGVWTTYLPIVGDEGVLGVAGLVSNKELADEQRSRPLLRLIVAQLAIALDYRRMESEREAAAVEAQTEKMRGNLLRAISHDLRTPLTSIYGASSALIENGEIIDPGERRKMLENVRENAQWLIRMVENLLSVTRIGQNASQLVKTPEAAEEIIGAAVANLRKSFPDAKIEVGVPGELLMVPMDATLIQQVIINLAENAVKYAQSERPIGIFLSRSGNDALFEVQDHGRGIPPQQIGQAFDGGLSEQRSSSGDAYRGMGIGLPICKTIVTAHGGKIGVNNRPEGGSRFYFTLPLKGEQDEPTL